MAEGKVFDYTFRYKCRRCGMTENNLGSRGTKVKALLELASVLKTGTYQSEGSGFILQVVDTHFCEFDGGLGVIDIVGVTFKEKPGTPLFVQDEDD